VGVSVNSELPYRANDTERICSICLEAMEEEEGNLFTVAACSHTYHLKCLAKWKKESRKCPCCRGPLPDEIGPTGVSLRSLFLEEGESDMNEGVMLKNLMFCPIGIVYPIFLFAVFIAFEAFVFCIFIVLVYLFTMYELCLEQDAIVSCCLTILSFILYPILAAWLVVLFIFQIFYAFFRTLKFYVMVLMCKISWWSADSFIVKRTMTVTENLYDDMFSE